MSTSLILQPGVRPRRPRRWHVLGQLTQSGSWVSQGPAKSCGAESAFVTNLLKVQRERILCLSFGAFVAHLHLVACLRSACGRPPSGLTRIGGRSYGSKGFVDAMPALWRPLRRSISKRQVCMLSTEAARMPRRAPSCRGFCFWHQAISASQLLWKALRECEVGKKGIARKARPP